MSRIIGGLWSLVERIAVAFLSLLFRITGRELTPSVKEGFLQFIKFGIVGLTNTVVNYLVYAAALLFLRKMGWIPGYDYYISQVISYILSVLWSFYWNNKMVFTVKSGEHRNLWAALIKTYISYSFTGLLLSNVLLYLWVNHLHISEFVAPILSLVITVPLNFLINKFWAFRSKGTSE